MLSPEQIEAASDVFYSRMASIETEYLRLIAKHILSIGKLTSSDVYRIDQFRRMGRNTDRIRSMIASAANKSVKDVEKLMTKAALSNYQDAAKFYDQMPFAENVAAQSILRAQIKQTSEKLINLSNTTVIDSVYREAISEAVTYVQTGVTDYQSAIRKTIRKASAQGLRVQYASGLTRRLDTAVRQNVIDSVRELNQSIADEVGEEFGADGFEISAHANCAKDHVDLQGKQYTKAEFERLQATLKRPIGDFNCKHFAFPILIGVSEPAHTKDQLREFKKNSNENIEYKGVKKSRYEWTQEQRKIETAIRYQKDIANAAKSAENTKLRQQAQSTINDLSKEYSRISKAAGIEQEKKRMTVAGFRPVKT